MRDSIVTKGIILTRIDFQEADRIITVLTPDHGKVKAIAKGVRRTNSKMAGGIELFSISNVTFLPKRGELQTLVSSRLITYFENIVKDINRTMLGYDLLKRINRATEAATGEEYFTLLSQVLAGLNDLDLDQQLVELWFSMQLLKISGHSPNLRNDAAGNKFEAAQTYLFDFDDMAFRQQQGAPFSGNHIKLLRLAMGLEDSIALKQVKDSADYAPESLQLAKTMLSRYIRV
jgi:DNA repair protein RecO (recombination protein O)